MTDTSCIRKEPWNIKCKVIKQEGTCGAGHKVGDEIIITENEIIGKICFSALYSMMPKIYALMYNAYLPWLKNQCVATHACPDAFNPLVVELERIEKIS
jgi:uncharacterized repeat protein (TIGR04076 family)